MAYTNKTSEYYNCKILLELISKGLKYWNDNDFIGDKLHNDKITAPTKLVRLILLVSNFLPFDLVKRAQPIIDRTIMNAFGVRPPGSNRIVIAGILALNLLLVCMIM